MSDGTVGVKQDTGADRLIDNEVVDGVYRQRVRSYDHFAADEPLADQTGTDTELTFTPSQAADMWVVFCTGGRGRASVSGDPSATRGIVCDEEIPTYIPVVGTALKVHVIGTVTVAVSALRYGVLS